MNQDKARELFSAYYENILDGGLKQSLEQQLKADPSLHADYLAFAETLRELDTLKHEDIEIPIYLSDRIATRLEQVQQKQKVGLPLWTTWIRGLAFGAVAIAAITFALPLFKGDRSVSVGGISTGGGVDQVVFKEDGANVVLNYSSNSPKTIVVSSPATGKVVEQFKVDGQRLASPIENPQVNPAVFKVQVSGDSNSSLLVLPGSGTTRVKAGDGSVQDLAVALSAHYHVPVVIEAADVTHHVSWNFSASTAVLAANQALAGESFSVDQRPDGIIKILDR